MKTNAWTEADEIDETVTWQLWRSPASRSDSSRYARPMFEILTGHISQVDGDEEDDDDQLCDVCIAARQYGELMVIR